jgi:hypothetical protein
MWMMLRLATSFLASAVAAKPKVPAIIEIADTTKSNSKELLPDKEFKKEKRTRAIVANLSE